jgi:hypothetical protein
MNAKGGGKSSSSRPHGSGNNSRKSCYYCGKKGHLKADCWNRQQDHGSNGGSARVALMAKAASARPKLPEDNAGSK